MISLDSKNPSQQVQPLTPLSHLANAFDLALMQVDLKGYPSYAPGEVEVAIADAIVEYCLLDLNAQLIIDRLRDYI